MNSIVRFIRSNDECLQAMDDDRVVQVYVQDIFFVEAVNDRTFVYTSNKVYEIKTKLYAFAQQYAAQRFIRCSKSFVINILKIEYVKPMLNSRLSAIMLNGEEIIISRQYVAELKKLLLGGEK